MPCDVGGRDCKDESTIQGKLRIPSHHQKLGETGNRFSLRSPENPADTLISDFWPPNCERINISILSHPVCSTLFKQH